MIISEHKLLGKSSIDDHRKYPHIITFKVKLTTFYLRTDDKIEQLKFILKVEIRDHECRLRF